MGTVIKFIAVIFLVSFTSGDCCCQININENLKQADSSEIFHKEVVREIIRDSLPHRVGRINDFEKLFSKKQEKTLDSIIADYENKKAIEICIITIDTTLTTKKNFDDFVLFTHNMWEVGKKVKENGIVIGISTTYRQIRISNGYGIENILTDSETKQIIDNDFIPLFKQGEYYGGTLNGLLALIRKLNENSK